MGWFQRMFGTSDAARLERAQHFLARQRYNDARLELEGVEGAEAEALRKQALAVLVAWNIEEAQARTRAGDPEGAQEHLDLARQFGATDEDMRSVRRLAREVREEKRREAEEKAAAEAENIHIPGDDPLWRLPPDHPRLRYAILVESYPDALRGRLIALGEDFAAAAILLEDGHAQAAVGALTPFAQAEPVARYERARAAVAAGQLPVAASDLLVFGKEVGHQRIGATHTAVMLASTLAQLGRAREALDIIVAEQQRAPELELEAVRVGLLEAVGELEQAESAASRLIQQAPRQMGLYRQLARIRERQGERVGAAEVLEWGLNTCCSSPGKCGNQPLDIQAVRSLARLYLEDRVNPERTTELLDKLARHVSEPGWEDHYIAALAARNQSDPRAPELARRLVDGLSPQDPRHAIVTAAFGA